jgi:TRAP-type uncharacterized transport system substrate-binding protein
MMRLSSLAAGLTAPGRGKGLVRALLVLIAGGVIASVAADFGIVRDYGYLRASILAGSVGGQYHTVATHLSDRAAREHGRLTVIATAGSIENVSRLAAGRGHCGEMFGLIQDGTPVPSGAGLELLGRLPQRESLLLLTRQSGAFHSFADLSEKSVGIGPEASGTAYLMQLLFKDADLRGLNIHFSYHELPEQAELVAEGKLDIAAYVMEEDADFLQKTIRQHRLEIISFPDLQGLISRYPWLSVGSIPAGLYDLVHPLPAQDEQIIQLSTLVVANNCARRADRIALLMLLGAELPGFVRGNPPSATGAGAGLPLAPEARQFFLTGEPEVADRYFPWLVNIMSPVYWVYLFMAVTILFNVLKGFSRFRLWRIDSAREKLESALKGLVDPKLTHAQLRTAPVDHVMAMPEKRAAVQDIVDQLVALRSRCQRDTNSPVTPMGDEMFYRYQQMLIDEAITTSGTFLRTS